MKWGCTNFCDFFAVVDVRVSSIVVSFFLTNIDRCNIASSLVHGERKRTLCSCVAVPVIRWVSRDGRDTAGAERVRPMAHAGVQLPRRARPARHVEPGRARRWRCCASSPACLQKGSPSTRPTCGSRSWSSKHARSTLSCYQGSRGHFVGVHLAVGFTMSDTLVQPGAFSACPRLT
jgi:hypothetical protein